MKLSEELTRVLCTYDDDDLNWYRHEHGYEFLEEYRLLSNHQCGDTSHDGVTPMEVIYQDEQLRRWKCLWNKVHADDWGWDYQLGDMQKDSVGRVKWLRVGDV